MFVLILGLFGLRYFWRERTRSPYSLIVTIALCSCIFFAVYDLAIVPLSFSFWGEGWYVGSERWAIDQPDDLSFGWFLVFLTYAALFASLWFFSRPYLKRKPQDNMAPQFIFGPRYRYAAVIMYCIGMVSCIAIVIMLMRLAPLKVIIFQRLIFTNREYLESAWFAYLRNFFIPLPKFAFLYLLLAARNSLDRKMAVGMLLGYLPFLIIAGGRYSLLICLLEFGVILWVKSGLQPLQPRRVILWSSFIFLNILIVSAFRFASESIGGAALSTLLSFSMRILRVSQAAWIADNMPDHLAFSGIQNGLITFDEIVPGLGMGHLSLVNRALSELYPSDMSESLSAPTFPNAAELYSWAGIPSIVLFGFLYGALFACLFRFARRRPSNPYWFLLSFFVLFDVLFTSLPGRMPDALRSIVYIAVILVSLASVAEKRSAAGMVFLGSVAAVFLGILTWRFTQLDMFKWLSMTTILFMYIAAFAYLKRMRTGPRPNKPYGQLETGQGRQYV